jgi:hypothetical protein
MSINDSIGTLFEGGLFARAVEPRTGEGAHEEAFEGTCLNCGTVRVGPHCHRCGQRAHIHRTMVEFGHDLLHGALHLEGKTFRTLPLLAWRPGRLTRRYIDGERARFVSPMALFLFSVFLMFAVFQLAGITPPTDFGTPSENGGRASPAEVRDELADLRKARAGMEDRNPGAPFVDMQIARLEAELAGAPPSAAPSPKPGETVTIAEGKNSKLTTRYTGIRFIDHGVDKWRENPSLMAYKLQSNSYKFSWLLIPLSLPFVWLLFFWKRRPRFGMYDHAVFVTYSLGFMTLFYVALVLLGGIGVGTGTLGVLGTLVPLLHIYKQLKGTYSLSRFSALWRTVALSGLIFVILFLFVDALLLLGAIG